jgi:DNA modification methylase
MKNSGFKSVKEVRSGYYWRDASSLVSSLEERSVDVTITSPPYGSLKDYGARNQIGYGQSYEEYLNALSHVFELLYSKAKESGSLWVVADTFKERGKLRLFPFDLCVCLGAIGWQLQDVIIWNKTKTLPWSRRGQLRRTFEYLLFFSKGPSFKYFIDRIKEPDKLKEWWVKYPERYSPEGRVPTTIWNFPIPVQGSWSRVRFRHFCPFPVGLVERIILLTTNPGDLVVDPFAGSGIVLAQAKVMRRRFIGCDVNKSYREQFHEIIAGHIEHRWDENKRFLKATDATRRELAHTIRKLRQVKFPKALFKELRRALGPSQVSGVKGILAKAVPLNGRSLSGRFSHVFVYFLCERGAPIAVLEREGRKLAIRPPLSKYGITATVHARCLEDFWRSRDGCLLRGQKLFLYLEGATHYYSGEFMAPEGSSSPLPEWKRVPPIVVNVDVRQKPVRTWAPMGTES